MTRISDLSVEHLGADATEALLAQFVRACDAAIARYPSIWHDDDDVQTRDDEVLDFVWNNGDFGVSIRELLGEELA